MTHPIAIVDAFTCGPFTGNPAAVCLVEEEPDASWMQAVAGEMNLSETVFVRAQGDGFALRYYTPTVEVPLCGHATLAAAHLLWERGVADGPIAFRTAGGELGAARHGDLVELDLPRVDPKPTPFDQSLLEILGVMPLCAMKAGDDLLVEVGDADSVRGAQVQLARLRPMPYRGLILTAEGDNGYDVVSRFFAPAAGIPEDPVTGSAHAALGPYWSKRLRRDELRCHQASRRGGELHVRVGDERVAVAGRAATVLDGELRA